MTTINPCLEKKLQEHLFLYQPDKQDLLKIFQLALQISKMDLRDANSELVKKNITKIKTIAQTMHLSLDSAEEIGALVRVIKKSARLLSNQMSDYAEAQYQADPIYALLHAYDLLEKLPKKSTEGEHQKIASVLQRFDGIIPHFSSKVLTQVWVLGGQLQGDPNWAEKNMTSELGKRAIASQLDELFASLSQEDQNQLDGIIYEIAESPKGGDNWGAENRTKDPKRFIKAFTLLRARSSLHASLESQPHATQRNEPEISEKELDRIERQIRDKSFEEIIEILEDLDHVPEEIKWHVVDLLFENNEHYNAFLENLSIRDQLLSAMKKEQSALLQAYELLEKLPENPSAEAKREIVSLLQKFDAVIPNLSTQILTKVWELGGKIKGDHEWAVNHLTKKLGLEAIQSQLETIIEGLRQADELEEFTRLIAQLAGPSGAGEDPTAHPKRFIQALTLLKTPIKGEELESKYLITYYDNPELFISFLKNHRLIISTPIVANPLDFNLLDAAWRVLDLGQKRVPKPLPAPESQPEAPQSVEEPKPPVSVEEEQVEEKTSGERAEIEQLMARKQFTQAIHLLKLWKDAPEDLKLQLIVRLVENKKFLQAYQVLALGISKIDYQLKVPLAEAHYYEEQNAHVKAHKKRNFATATLHVATSLVTSSKTDNTKVLESYEKGFKTLFEFAEKLREVQKQKPSYQDKLKLLALFDARSKEYAEVALPAYAKLLNDEGRSVEAAQLYEKFAFAKLRLMLDSNLLPDEQRKEQIKLLTKTFFEVRKYLQEAANLNPKEAEYDFWLGVVDAHLRFAYPVKSAKSEYQFQPHYHFYNAWCKNQNDPFYSALFWKTSRKENYPDQYFCSLQARLGLTPILKLMRRQALTKIEAIQTDKGPNLTRALFSLVLPTNMLTEKLNENRKTAYKALKIDDSKKLYL